MTLSWYLWVLLWIIKGSNQQYTYIDPQNPYCIQLENSTCVSCGSSDSNIYGLYDSVCTTITDQDAVFDNKIIRKCDPNCADCEIGLCNQCSTILGQPSFKTNYVYGTGYTSCTAKCDPTSGLFGDSLAETCQACPKRCAKCLEANYCLQCEYSYARWPTIFDSEKASSELFLNCSEHEERISLDPSSSDYIQKFYVAPQNQNNSNNEQPDGTFEKPFDNINLVFKQLIEKINIGSYKKIKIELYLLKDNKNTDHFWTYDDFIPVYYNRLFEGTLVDATIQPAFCDDKIKCFDHNEKVTVFLKSNLISVFVHWKLALKNIIFDASELIPDGICYNDNKNSNLRCCATSGKSIPTRADPESDAICNPTLSPEPLLIAYMNHNPSIDLWPRGPYSFITIEMIDSPETEVPELIIEDCEFNHFWYHRYAQSLITLDNRGSRIAIKNTKFNNFYFPHGLITNVQERIQRETLFTENVVPKYDCSLSSSSQECLSLIIQDSLFLNSAFDYITFSTEPNLSGYLLPENEGIVLFLVSFAGPIILKNNRFEKLAIMQFSISKPADCGSYTRLFTNELLHSVDRMIQIELGHEELENVRSGSVINIRNLVRGITIYNNTFTNNIASTGTNFFIHNFDNTETYPIIIEKNRFENNFGVLFGSSFAIVNYERDYVTMDCKGIYIYENIFKENIGCPNNAGNALVICIPDKSAFLPFFIRGYLYHSDETSKESFGETWRWLTYYPSVNQRIDGITGMRETYSEDFDSFTQDVFTEFVKYITQNKDKINLIKHPITQDLIDTSRIKVVSNNFSQNYVPIAQLFIQGAFNIHLDSNTFQNNFLADQDSMPSHLKDIPIFSKVYDLFLNQHLVSSPVVLRLANNINLEHNLFINNHQSGSSYKSTLVFGSAISIDRHLGAGPAIIYNCTFKGYINSADASEGRSLNFSPSETRILGSGGRPFGRAKKLSFITYSLWERLGGVNYIESSNSESNLSLTFVNATLRISKCTFQDNSFTLSFGIPEFSDPQDGRGIVWQFKDSDRVDDASILEGGTFKGKIVSSSFLYIEDSAFISNINEDDISFFNLYNFDLFFFMGNNLTQNSYGTSLDIEMLNVFRMKFDESYKPSVEISKNKFQMNSGRIIYIEQTFESNPGLVKFTDNNISDHWSANTLFELSSTPNIVISRIEISNLVSNLAVFHLQGSSAYVSIEEISLNGIKTSSGGCLLVESIDQGFTLNNFNCTNSELSISFKSGSQNQKYLTPCFHFENQHSTDIKFSNIRCDNSSILYNVWALTPNDFTENFCFYLSKLKNIVLENFSCSDNKVINKPVGRTTALLGGIYKTTKVTIKNGVFKNNQVEGPINVLAGIFSMDTVQVIESTAKKEAGFLLLQGGSTSYLKSVIFQNNSCKECLGTITSYRSDIYVENSTFINNTAKESSIFNVKMGILKINSSTFSKNIALVSASVITSDVTDLDIFNSTFEENLAKQNTIATLEGTAIIKACRFLDNEAITESKNIFAVGTKLFIEDSIFVGQSQQGNTIRGGFVSISNANVKITNCSFDGGYGQVGGAIAFDSKKHIIEIKNCSFTDNWAEYGGAVYLTGQVSSSAILEASKFHNNKAMYQGGSVYVKSGQANFLNSDFFSFEGNTLYFEVGNYILDGLQLIGNKNYLSKIPLQAIFVQDVSTFTLINTFISGFGIFELEISDMEPETSSSALTFEKETPSSKSYFLINVTFENNQAYKGGALYANGNVNITLIDCRFNNNKAIKGGAIFYDSKSVTSDFTISGKSKFIQNKASSSGGALQFTGRKIHIQGDFVSFIGNTAPYGANIGAYGVYVVPIQSNPQIYQPYLESKGSISYVNRILFDVNLTQDMIVTENSYVSGQTMNPPLMYDIRDEFGAPVTVDNSSTLTFQIASKDGHKIPPVFKGESSYFATNGYFVLFPLKIFAMPNSYVQIQASLANFDLESLGRSPSEFTKGSPVAKTSIFLRECIVGERFTDDHGCSPCPPGQYILTAGDTSSCKLCPKGGRCGGHNIFGPDEKFWRFSSTDHRLNECLNDEACLGASIADEEIRKISYCPASMLYNQTFCLAGWCREGYKGMLCTECAEGWATSNAASGTCSKCSDNVKYYIISILLAFLTILYIIIMIKNALNDEKTEQDEKIENLSAPKTVNEKQEISSPMNNEEKEGELLESQKSTPNKFFMSVTSDSRLNVKSSSDINQLTNQPQPSKNSIDPSNDLLLSVSRQPSSNTARPSLLKTIKTMVSKKIAPKDNSDYQNITSIYTKILTNYIHLISILGSFEFEWPKAVKQIFYVQDTIAKSSSEVFSFDCVLKQSFFAQFGLRTFFVKVLLISLSPILILISIVLTWSLIHYIKYRKDSGNFRSQLTSKIIMSIVVTLFILHPSIVEISIQAFQCTVLGDDPAVSSYLSSDLQLKCYGEEHLKLALPIGLPSLIFWGFGIPLFAWIILFKNRKNLQTSTNKARYGFLYGGYRTKVYFWEFVIFYRKMILILISTFMGNFSVDLQAITVLGVSACFYLLQIKILPYKVPTLNEMEKRSLIVSTITIYCGLFYLAGGLPIGAEISLFVIIIIANLYFLIYWIVEFLKAQSLKLLKNKFLEKHFGSCLRKLAVFEWRMKSKHPKIQINQESGPVSASEDRNNQVAKIQENESLSKDGKEDIMPQEIIFYKGEITPKDLSPLSLEKIDIEDLGDINSELSVSRIKKPRKTPSFHNLLFNLKRSNSNFTSQEPPSGISSASNSMCQLQKQDML